MAREPAGLPTAGQVTAAAAGEPTHDDEPHTGDLTNRLNWLRAGVLGANDGIVSVAAIVVGAAGATSARSPIFTVGLLGLVAGMVSMALGEYASVSSQRDAEAAQLAKEKQELEETPDEEFAELVAIYEAKGLTPKTAQLVAAELTAHDALAAHLDAELNLDPNNFVNPLHAAGASAIAFTIGGLLPLLAIVLPPLQWRVPIAVLVVLLALVGTGALSARLSGADVGRSVLRLVIFGGLGLAFTYGVGSLFGTALG
jgi:VIT1/CCC1 family predicted Fe2+/Mn2+ transporter